MINLNIFSPYSLDGFAYFVYGQNVTLIAPESYHGDFKLSYGRSLTIVFILGTDPVNEDSYIRYLL